MASLHFSEGGSSPPVALRKKQLLNHIIDGMASARPSAIYAEIPRSLTIYDAGYRKVTYRALANAINGVAWWLKESLDESQHHETLTYIGANDIQYVVMILGAAKAGYKLLLVSPRNTVSDHISLFKATECSVLLTPASPRSPIVQGILDAHPLKVLDSPSLDDLLSRTYAHYPFNKTFAEARNQPFFAVHTSGTTAIPKPIIYNHDFFAAYSQHSHLSPPAGFESQASLVQSNRHFITLPFFHAGNLYATLFDAIPSQTIIVTPLAGVMPSVDNIVEGLKRAPADALFLAPPFVEQIAKDPAILDFISKTVETVSYGGGAISQWAGDILTSRVKFLNFYGSTETGSLPVIRKAGQFPSEDWKYIHPHPSAGIEFRPAFDGRLEGVIVRNPAFEDEQPVFKIFPNLTEFSTKDLWSPHPSKPGMWEFRGRADDSINFKAAYMCDPVPMEQAVSRHPGVQAVLMAGTGRSQPALIIEAAKIESSSPGAQQELTTQLWPLIEEANREYKLGARVTRSHLLYTDPDRPMRRAGKGTIQRGPTLELYRDALNALYDREGDHDLGKDSHLYSNGQMKRMKNGNDSHITEVKMEKVHEFDEKRVAGDSNSSSVA